LLVASALVWGRSLRQGPLVRRPGWEPICPEPGLLEEVSLAEFCECLRLRR